jgi:integrase
MSKGRGSLYRAKYRDRKTGEWRESPYWSMSYQAYRDGKWTQVRKSTGATSKAEANRMLNAVMGQGKRNAPSRATLAHAVELLRAEYEAKRQRSWDRAARSASHVLAHFGEDTRLVDIDRAAVRSYRAERLSQNPQPANATVNRELSCLRAAMNLAADDGLLDSVPSFRKLLLPEPKNTAQYISLTQLGDLIEGMPRYAALAIRFLYLSGARVNDALRLEWSDIDMEAGWIRFYVSKTDEYREQPIIGPMGDLLEELRAHRAEVGRATGRLSERVFVNEAGKQVTYSRLRAPWEKARGSSGLRIHDLRASCVTNLANAGVPSLQAKEWTGHAGLEVHDRYNVVNRQALAAVGERYATMFPAE